MLEHLISFVDRLGNWGFLIIFLVVMLECQAVFGLFIPGESLVLASGFMAAQELFDLDDLIFVVSAAAIVGDTISYELGRNLGRAWLLNVGKRFGLQESQLHRVEAFFPRHGGKSVFMSHFLHIGRALMPFLAGSARMKYLRFASWNAAGCIVWATVFVLAGYFAGESWMIVAKWIGRTGAIVAVTILAAIVGIALWKRRTARREIIKTDMQ